jgi:hypothetical protein
MSDKRRDKYLPLVVSLVESALGLSRNMIHAVESDTEIDKLIGCKAKPHVLWIRNREDQIYQFWRLRKEGALADGCWVIFTGINETNPLYRDLDDYVGGKFGSIYVFRYEALTRVGVKPSQRGMYM